MYSTCLGLNHEKPSARVSLSEMTALAGVMSTLVRLLIRLTRRERFCPSAGQWAVSYLGRCRRWQHVCTVLSFEIRHPSDIFRLEQEFPFDMRHHGLLASTGACRAPLPAVCASDRSGSSTERCLFTLYWCIDAALSHLQPTKIGNAIWAVCGVRQPRTVPPVTVWDEGDYLGR